ncbi:MAG: hypothetical protein LUO93_05080 [Methanomicrobiales archaeon]|nr:hypothetical protein [Methanomicrobiales archaeon]
MLDRLRSLFGKEVRTPKEIPFDELIPFIESQEEAIRIHLEEEVATRRPQIVAAIENVREILDSVSDIERKPSSHPKLEKIAQSSLPHFVRSLQQHVSRPLPERAEEFYHEVSVLLKGCINDMRGAGKYLPMVFPEEMKALRHEIGIIGRTINELTTLVSQAKEKRRQLISLRTTWSTIRSLTAGQNERIARIEKMHAKSALLRAESERVRQSMKGLERSAEYRELEKRQHHLSRSLEEAKNLKLQKGQVLGTVLSLYRRAARIARHQNSREKEKILEETIDLLESSSQDCERISSCIQGTVASLMEFIHSGALPLKGQDEQRIFSSPQSAADEIYQACDEIRSADRGIEELQDQIRDMPVHGTLLQLRAEEGRLSHDYEKTLQECTEEEDALKSLPGRIKTLENELKGQIPVVLGEECSVIFARLGEPVK